jgi:hypothetical protein|uniref:Uncharacterized protein n=1 Tax=viral metagenome TaxID=1070528 RepID=A0A6C0IHR1_9ZZZZ
MNFMQSATPTKATTSNSWTDMIPDNVLCGYFYIFFIIFCVFAAISFIGGVWIFSTSKMPFSMLISMMFNILLSFGISATSALFLYLICDRALHPALKAAQKSQ